MGSKKNWDGLKKKFSSSFFSSQIFLKWDLSGFFFIRGKLILFLGGGGGGAVGCKQREHFIPSVHSIKDRIYNIE